MTFFSGHILKVKLIMVIKGRQPDTQLYACTNLRKSNLVEVMYHNYLKYLHFALISMDNEIL